MNCRSLQTDSSAIRCGTYPKLKADGTCHALLTACFVLLASSPPIGTHQPSHHDLVCLNPEMPQSLKGKVHRGAISLRLQYVNKYRRVLMGGSRSFHTLPFPRKAPS